MRIAVRTHVRLRQEWAVGGRGGFLGTQRGSTGVVHSHLESLASPTSIGHSPRFLQSLRRSAGCVFPSFNVGCDDDALHLGTCESGTFLFRSPILCAFDCTEGESQHSRVLYATFRALVVGFQSLVLQRFLPHWRSGRQAFVSVYLRDFSFTDRSRERQDSVRTEITRAHSRSLGNIGYGSYFASR
jgi:hypothetical protein